MSLLALPMETSNRCGQCLKLLGPGPKWRARESHFVLCEPCAQRRLTDGAHLVRQFGWGEHCPICYGSMANVCFTCKSDAWSDTQLGHTFCLECSYRLGVKRVGCRHRLVLPEHPVKCPVCSGQFLSALQLSSDLFVILSETDQEQSGAHRSCPGSRSHNTRRARKQRRRRAKVDMGTRDEEERWEIIGFSNVRLTLSLTAQVRVRWASCEESWVELDDLDEGTIKEAAKGMLEELFGF